MRPSKFLPIIPGVLVLLGGVIPLSVLIFNGLTLTKLSDLPVKSLINTLILGIAVALTTTIIGSFMGIVLARTKIYFSKAILILMAMPMVISPYVLAQGWSNALLHISNSINFQGAVAVYTILVNAYVAIPMLVTYFLSKAIEPSIEEAGLILMSWPKVLLKITIPMIFQGIIFSTIVVFLLASGNFTVPMFFRFNSFSVDIFTRFAAFYDYKGAAIMSLPIILLTILLSYILFRFTAYINVINIHTEPVIIKLKTRANILIHIIIFLLLIVFVVLPASGLISGPNIISGIVLAIKLSYRSLIRSMLYGLITGVIVITAGVIIVIYNLGKVFDLAQFTLFALPGALIGIGLIVTYGGLGINDLPVLLITGLFTRYLLFGTKAFELNYRLIPPSLIDAARLYGLNTWQCFVKIILPLTLKGLIAGITLVFLFCVRDVGLSMVVYPPGGDPLSVRAFTLMANGSQKLVSGMILLQALLSLIPLIIAWPILWRQK